MKSGIGDEAFPDGGVDGGYHVCADRSWLYVAAIKGLFAGEVVGRSRAARMTVDLVERASEQAVAARPDV